MNEVATIHWYIDFLFLPEGRYESRWQKESAESGGGVDELFRGRHRPGAPFLAGEFDTSQTFELHGAITKVEWTNPHIYIYVDMVDKGQTVHWQCEMGSPNQLIRQGSKKTDLPIGTVIRAQANPARDGSKTCSTRKITLDDGKPVFTRTGAY